jgi:hypothetical protein
MHHQSQSHNTVTLLENRQIGQAFLASNGLLFFTEGFRAIRSTRFLTRLAITALALTAKPIRTLEG